MMAGLKLPILLLSAYFLEKGCTLGVPFLSFDKTIRIDRFLGRCPDKEKFPMYMRDIRITQDHRIYYILCKIVITDELSNKLKVQLQLERCKSKESLDTCEPYPDIYVKNMCELIGINFQPWTPFIRNLKPRISCPIKKAVYVSTNGTFDGTALSAFAVEGWYWKIRANIIDPNYNNTNKIVMCVYVEGQVVNI